MELAEEFGIITGRFQVSELHQAHIDLIREVQEKHERVDLHDQHHRLFQTCYIVIIDCSH